MPRFHFNIYDGHGLLDHEGHELPDWQTAQRIAVRHAGEVIQDDAQRIVPDKDWRMEVTDETGLILLRLDFSVLLSPVLANAAAAKILNTRVDPKAE